MSPLHRLFQTLLPRFLHRIVALVFLITLPLALGLVWLNVAIFRSEMQPYMFRMSRALSQYASSEIILHIEQTQSQLTAIGTALLEGGGTSDADRLELIGHVLSKSKLLDFIAVYGPDMERRLVAKAVGAMDPLSLPEKLPEFQFNSNHLGIGNIVAGPEGPMLEIALKVMDESSGNQTLAWLYSQIDLKTLCALVSELQKTLPLHQSSLFVIDTEGRLIVHPQVELLGGKDTGEADNLVENHPGTSSLANYSGVAEFEKNGTQMMRSVWLIEEFGWRVVVTHAKEDASKDLESALKRTSNSILASLATALAAGILLARSISKPLRSLNRATQLLARREFEEVEPALSARSDEFGQLANAFNRMSKELKVYESQLIRETQVRAALSRYLPADIVENLIQNPEALRLGGERRFVTVLFCDVVGFGYISESLPPETIVSLLNELFSIATEIIHKRKGIVDKFIGDCIMAVWGVPASHPDDAQMALLAAEDLRRWLEVGNRRWRQKWGVEIQLAMGIHSGMAVAGNIGSAKRMDYTVIGETVSIAARLEDSAQAGQILLSEETRALLQGDTSSFKRLDDKTLRGKSATTLFYEVPE